MTLNDALVLGTRTLLVLCMVLVTGSHWLPALVAWVGAYAR